MPAKHYCLNVDGNSKLPNAVACLRRRRHNEAPVVRSTQKAVQSKCARSLKDIAEAHFIYIYVERKVDTVFYSRSWSDHCC